MKSQIYLVQNYGGVSLEVVGGPFDPNAVEQIEGAIIQLVKEDSGLGRGGDDSLHTLEIGSDGKPEFGGFSGGYLGNIRWVAAGCPPSEKPDTWDHPEFALAAREQAREPQSVTIPENQK